MTRQMAVQKWTCSEHDYPRHCEECDTWHCEECRTSEWETVGWRDATAMEDLLLSVPLPARPPFFLLDAIARGSDDDLGGGKVTLPLVHEP